jgi:LysM repeat protein
LKGWLQLVVGSIMAFVSIGLIYGSVLVSLAENGFLSAQSPIEGTQLFFEAGRTQEQGVPSSFPVETRAFTSQPDLTSVCTPSIGWQRYTVHYGDTFASLAMKFDTPISSLTSANCLKDVMTLLPGTMINVPETSSTMPAMKCGAPGSWPTYYVQAGETLYDLSRLLEVSVSQLQYANCMGSSTTIQVGQALRVPILPVYTPTSTFTRLPSATPFPSSTIPSLTPIALTPIDYPTLEFIPFEIIPGTQENLPELKNTPEPTASVNQPAAPISEIIFVSPPPTNNPVEFSDQRVISIF